MRARGLLIAAVVAGSVPLRAAWADAAESAFHVELGGESRSGKFGQRDETRVRSLDAVLDWDITGTTRLSLDGSWLSQSAPAGTIAGGGRLAHLHRGSGAVKTTRGVGDTIVGLEQQLLQQSESMALDWSLRGEVKLGTADVHKGLGSGKTDYTASTSVGHAWGRVSGRAEAGYSVLGSPGSVVVNGSAENIQYRNVWSSSLGIGLELGERNGLDLAFAHQQSSSTSASDRASPAGREVDLAFRSSLSHRTSLRAWVFRGIGRASPDLGGGLSLSVGF